METSFKALLESSTSVLILLPQNPDFDQVAAGVSLYLALKKQKEVSISCPTPMVVEFNRLVGVNQVSTDLGNKNMVISFKDYQATNIEKVSYDIDGGEFKLTVIPKAGFLAPNKDQIILGFSGVTAGLVILIGGVDEVAYPSVALKDFSGAKMIHIGLRAPMFNPGIQTVSFARPASSVSEIVVLLLREAGMLPDPDMATNLLWGIEMATDSFITKSVTAETFQAAADLIRAGGKRQQLEMLQQQVQPAPGMGGQMNQQQLLQKLQTMMAQPMPAPVVQPQPGVMPAQPLAPAEPAIDNPPNDWLAPKIYKGTSVS